jgi:cytochrome c556
MGVGTSLTALSQNQMSGSANDVIFARKTLMATIARNMYPIDEMREIGKYDLEKGRANADSISGMLMAFPHLFPPTTNTWTDKAPRDPAVDTFASPAVWQAYDSFYKEAQAASKIAFDLSHAENEVQFRTGARELRAGLRSLSRGLPKEQLIPAFASRGIASALKNIGQSRSR